MDVGQYQGFHVELHEPGIAVATFDEPDRALVERTMALADAREGGQAFRQKRQPGFNRWLEGG